MANLNLPNVREGGDIRFRIGLEDNGVAVDWSGLEGIRVFLYADAQKQVSGECTIEVDAEDNTVLACLYSGDDPQFRGINSVLVRAKYQGEIKVYDKPAINIVARTADADGVLVIDDPVVPVQINVEEVSTSLLNNAIDAAINAAAEAEKAIEDVRDEETAIQAAEAARVLAEQGRVSAEQSRVAQASADHTLAGQDHTRAESDHGTASGDHTLAVSDHGVASGDHTTALVDHSLAESDHTRAESDHGVAGSDHTIAQGDHTQAGSDHSTAVADHTQAGADHTVAGKDHTQAGTDHNTAASDHTQAGLDHTQAWEDHTQALADHQVMAGYDDRLDAVEVEVDQLEAKVDEKWTIGEDVKITGFLTGAYATYGNLSTTILNKAGAKGKILDVVPGQKYRIYATSDSSIWYRCCAIYKADGTKISEAPAGDYTTTPYEITIPSDCAKMVINLINYNAATDGAFLIAAEETDAATLDGKIESIKTSVDSTFLQTNFERGIHQKADRYSSIMVDWMDAVHAVSGMTSTDALSVVSSTASSITLSSSDAATFTDGYNPCIVRWNDGTTKLVYFDKASGTSVPRMSFDSTDLTGATLVQSIHDTAKGGNGIHLSPLGYINLGQWMAEEIEKKNTQKDKNLLSGVQFYTATESSDKKSILSAEGIKVASVDTDMPTTGATPGGHLNSVGIVNYGFNASLGGFLYVAYRFVQGKDHYISFNIPANGEGWLEIQAGQTAVYDSSTGTVRMEVYVDDVLSSSVNLVRFNRKYSFEGLSAKKSISVKFVTDVADCECAINSINFFAMSAIVPAVDLAGKKVAFLGDSWTQFPPASTALPEYADYNSPTMRPDGTEGGYGYLPKAFADASGAIVDNWGKSNMTSENWGLVMIDTVLAYTQYDYLVIEFFINDQNLGISYDAWARNIALIAEKCKKANVRPIIVCPCLQNGPTVNPFGIRHEMIMRGLGTF